MPDCLFCQIASGQTNTQLEYQDTQVAAFADIHPKAPIHLLIVPKKHIANIDEVEDDDEALVGHLITVARDLARQKKIATTGYRLIINVRRHGGQVIDHLHLHLIGGQPLGPFNT